MGRTRIGIEMWKEYHNRVDTPAFILSFVNHLKYTLGRDHNTASDWDLYLALANAVRDRLVDRMIQTQQAYNQADVKRVYYLSVEYLVGKFLEKNIRNLGIGDVIHKALADLEVDYGKLCAQETDAGLGNGGLGRLAACFMDSLATLEYPAYGYGLRYDFGIFQQEIRDGAQVERPDDWLRFGNPWEIQRPQYRVPVGVYGHVEHVTDAGGAYRPRWVPGRTVIGVPYDYPIVGYQCPTVNILRLWSARASEEFDFGIFNTGDYEEAVAGKFWAETITKILYPNDAFEEGRELRLIQEYFFVACTISDILRRYDRAHDSLDALPDKVAIQLNDTHPALAIVELMRVLVDLREVPWKRAWELTTASFAYTNHTLLPEALERWSVDLIAEVLPRHLEIIYEINRRFLDDIRDRYPGEDRRVQAMSIIQEEPYRQARMANLAIIGSHSVNGVAAIHSDLVTKQLVPEFAHLWPEKFNNKTNGITPRRWLLVANPGLASLVTTVLGNEDWAKDLEQLKGLESVQDDPGFHEAFRKVKRENKDRLATLIRATGGPQVDPDALFDVQVKRLHEYKRQLLNALHIVHLRDRMREDQAFRDAQPPRVFIFGAKAAPGYWMAKLILRFINAVADSVNEDPKLEGKLKVAFIPNYGVTNAQVIIPGADISEQISTAGYEASGTSNMKFALNGALTVGTLDGANVEIRDAVGAENFYLFGLTADEVVARGVTHDPRAIHREDPVIQRTVDALLDPAYLGAFRPIWESLVEQGDHYLLLADFHAYAETHQQAGREFQEPRLWTRKAILNVARMGWFSSDRTIRQYAEDIWNVQPHHTAMKEGVLTRRLKADEMRPPTGSPPPTEK